MYMDKYGEHTVFEPASSQLHTEANILLGTQGVLTTGTQCSIIDSQWSAEAWLSVGSWPAYVRM